MIKMSRKNTPFGKGTKLIGEESVICHKLNYQYAMFYCHEIDGTKAYSVSLKQVVMGGVNGESKKDNVYEFATAICHSETESWIPSIWIFYSLMLSLELPLFVISFAVTPLSLSPTSSKLYSVLKN